MFSDSRQKPKQLYYRPGQSSPPAASYSPHFFVEAKIDINDVRSAFHETRSVACCVAIHPEYAEASWTGDMVRFLDTSLVGPDPPRQATLRPLPGCADEVFLARMETEFVNFMLRHFKVRILRNYDLKIYSGPEETREGFVDRCLELLGEPFRRDLSKLYDVWLRRLEQIKRKCSRELGLASFEFERMATEERQRLHLAAEELERLFSETKLALEVCRSPRILETPGTDELAERIHGLQAGAERALADLLNRYRANARNVDEYILHLNWKDVHLVRTCIIWMPEG